MRVLLLVSLIYVTAVLETSLADVLRVGDVAPDLLAMLAIIWVLLVPGSRTFLAAGAIGLAGDLISPGRIGLGMACFLLVGYGVGRLRSRFNWNHFIWQVPVVWLGVTLLAAALAAGQLMFKEATLPPSALAIRAAGVGIYTAGVSLPILMTIGWLREPSRKPLGT